MLQSLCEMPLLCKHGYCVVLIFKAIAAALSWSICDCFYEVLICNVFKNCNGVIFSYKLNKSKCFQRKFSESLPSTYVMYLNVVPSVQMQYFPACNATTLLKDCVT